MVSEEQRAYFFEYVAGWDDHDFERVMAQFAEGATYDDPVISEPSNGDELKRYYAETIEGFPDLQFDGRVFDTQEDGVLVNQWTGSGTHSGTYFGLPPTGRHIAIDGVSIFTISDDGIIQITCYFDRSTVREQLGISFPEIVGQVPGLIYGVLTRAINRG